MLKKILLEWKKSKKLRDGTADGLQDCFYNFDDFIDKLKRLSN